MTKKESDDQYSTAEASRRRDAITRAMIATPPHVHEPLKAKRKKPRKVANASTGRSRGQKD